MFLMKKVIFPNPWLHRHLVISGQLLLFSAYRAYQKNHRLLAAHLTSLWFTTTILWSDYNYVADHLGIIRLADVLLAHLLALHLLLKDHKFFILRAWIGIIFVVNLLYIKYPYNYHSYRFFIFGFVHFLFHILANRSILVFLEEKIISLNI